ncbi:hypothetical protein [Thermocoleostomius sinensis]|uniref:Uncharacterized protein n=1 Tax=Thermocoleostomius sinensis A174 TaxID=2016057 RepID=A0A9E8ZBL1_9CYAN|nr:hypothetical protein [Thermocoleostomius sinensis]WAL59841.1 hypothetical protein OXH18_22140 [Thermocoleostomius sinensis A174]
MSYLSSISIKEQLALRIASETQKQMDSILERIQQIAKEFKIAEKDKRSPFRNVLAVAVESTASLEIIKNYIRYQVGRGNNSSPIWILKQNKKLFAEALVEALDALRQDAEEILKRIEEACEEAQKQNKSNEVEAEQETLLKYLQNSKNQAMLQRDLHLELARLYLGYLAREHTALVGEQKENPKTETHDEKQKASKTVHGTPNQPTISK